jgi:hypothetical protein
MCIVNFYSITGGPTFRDKHLVREASSIQPRPLTMSRQFPAPGGGFAKERRPLQETLDQLSHPLIFLVRDGIRSEWLLWEPR